jgi:hypothetical protein
MQPWMQLKKLTIEIIVKYDIRDVAKDTQQLFPTMDFQHTSTLWGSVYDLKLFMRRVVTGNRTGIQRSLVKKKYGVDDKV